MPHNYIHDGEHVTFGAKGDAAAASDTATASYIALFKRLLQKLTAGGYPDAARTIVELSGTTSASGDNTILAADAAHSYVITALTLQNESAAATTMLLKIGATTIERVLGQNQGDGVARVYPIDARPQGAVDAAIVLNLSGANACGYTIHYYSV